MRASQLLLLALPALPLAAQQKIDRRIAIAPDAAIRITNLVGTTRVLGWDRDSIAVTGTATPGANFYMGGASRAAKLGLETKEGSPAAPGSHLDVRVPRGARVSVRSVEGSIDVQAMTGEVDLLAVSGPIRVGGSLRLVTAESIDGDIEVVGVSPLVRVKTGSGRILLRQANGDVTATTVSGPIVATEMEPQGARFETVSGSVNYSGTVDRRGTLSVQTHSGDVELLLPSGLGAEYDLESLGGGVAAELPAKSGKPMKGKQLYFATGGGGVQIMVRSFKGQVHIFGQ